MNWKFKQFEQEVVFSESPERVLEAFRAFAAQKLMDWKITSTEDGLEAKGFYWSASETAKLRVEPTPSGTKLTVTLQVERATPYGYMLVDAFGFYDNQIRKWIDAIRWHLTPESATATPTLPVNNSNLAGQKLVLGCLGCSGLIVLLSWVIQSVYAVIGLITGSLYLLPARESNGVTIHGPAARIVALVFLLIDGALVVAVWRDKKKRERPTILPPS